MTHITQKTARSFLPLFLWAMLICGGLTGIYGDSPREARFPKVKLQTANVEPNLPSSNSGPVDFYDEYLKGKTAIVHLFYTTCDGGVCEAGAKKLEEVQKALGDNLGRDVFIYSITLRPNEDTTQMLKKYSEMFGAKPGWSFLRGSVEDIPALRRSVGQAGRSPDVLRKLFPERFGAGEKSIVAKAPMDWVPKAIGALPDDVIE